MTDNTQPAKSGSEDEISLQKCGESTEISCKNVNNAPVERSSSETRRTGDNTQELDEVLDEFLTDIYMNNEHFAANQEALDKTKEEPMQAILDWHNKQVKEVLDRLESMAAYDPSGSSPVINPRQIEAERKKLKERNYDR